MKYNTVAHYYRTNMIIVATLWILMTFLIIPTMLINREMSVIYPIMLLYSFPFFVMFLYYAVSYFQYRKIVLTNIQVVFLNKVASNAFLRQMGFEVELEINGKKEIIETKAIFSTATFIPHLSIDHYSGSQALVGYCDSKHEAIIIQLVDSKQTPNSVDHNE